MFISHLTEAVRSISPSYFIATTQIALSDQATGCAALMLPLPLRPAATLTAAQPREDKR